MSAAAAPPVLPFHPQHDARLVNQNVECSLLGMLLGNPKLLSALPATFASDHYAVAGHADIHRAIVEVGRPGAPALLPVANLIAAGDRELREHLVGCLQSAVGFMPSTVAQYADILTDLHRRRGIVTLANEMRAGAYEQVADTTADAAVARALTGLDELVTQHGDGRACVSLADAADAAMRHADDVAAGRVAGLSTGMPSVDDRLGRLESGQVIVLAGRPGMGKSALGLQWAVHAARQGAGVLAISLEMSAVELGRRALAVASGVPLAAMKRGAHAYHATALVQARREMQGLPFTIEDGGGLTAPMIALKARAAQRRHGVGLILVDHLHIVRPDAGDSRNGGTWATGQFSNAMKRLAKEFGCPMLLLAQLNRGPEGRDDHRPGLADLRHAGDIEQDADAVSFVYRAEYYMRGQPEKLPGETEEKFANRKTGLERDREHARGKAELIVAKVRDGEPGTVPLLFSGATTSFSEPIHDEE